MIFVILLTALLSQTPATGRETPQDIQADAQEETGQESDEPGREGTGPSVTGDSAAEDIIVIERRSPTGALLRSAALPGWGQFYNDEPLKGVILGAVEVGLLSWLVSEHIQSEDARKDYLATGDPDDLARYEEHSGRRLDLIWYTSAAWLYGMLDAYVDAYLYSFEAENRSFEQGAGIGVVVYVPF